MQERRKEQIILNSFCSLLVQTLYRR